MVIERDFDLVLGEQSSPTVEVLDAVVLEISLVDAVEALDVGVSLVFEGRPVEGSGFLDVEAIGLGIVDSLGESGGVVCYFLGDASVSRLVSICW